MFEYELNFPVRHRPFSNELHDRVRDRHLLYTGLVLSCSTNSTLYTPSTTGSKPMREYGVSTVKDNEAGVHTSMISSVCKPTDTAAYNEYAVNLYS